jgi:hypothetical protein
MPLSTCAVLHLGARGCCVLLEPANYLSLNATGCMTSKLSGVGCSFQFGRASAPMIPQRTHTIPWAEGQDRNVVGPIGAQDRRVAA